MQFFVLLIVFKIAIVMLFALLGAMFAAEFFPLIADKLLAATDGTALSYVGHLCSDVLHFFANLAHKFIDFVFNVLASFGLEMDGLREKFQNPDLDASGVEVSAPKIEKPQF